VVEVAAQASSSVGLLRRQKAKLRLPTKSCSPSISCISLCSLLHAFIQFGQFVINIGGWIDIDEMIDYSIGN
jgi:hypothetical protein